MTAGFWEKLAKPIFALAPMANVTDAAFRRIIAKYGKFTRPDGTRGGGPAVMFTEFVSADGLMSKGREKLLVDLMYSEGERPIVAQLFTGNPEKMYEAAKLVRELGFNGLDINMGCPDRAIEKSGAGAALIKNPRRAREIIRAAVEGATGLPVSVKTRLGYNKDELETWLPELLAERPVAVTIHARTRKEMSRVPAHWERVARAVEIRDSSFPTPPFQGGDVGGGSFRTLILGNGDVMSVAEARARAEETGADGIMLGRAIFGNPWLFSSRLQQSDCCNYNSQTVVRQRLEVLVEHARLFEELLGVHKNFAIMKKHFKAYMTHLDGGNRTREELEEAKALRMRLMEADNALEVEVIIAGFLENGLK